LTGFEEFVNIHAIKLRQALVGVPRFSHGIRMDPSTMQNTQKKVHTFLEKWLDKSIKQYVGAMDEQNNGHLHELIIGGIEKPLVEIVLKETNGNQTQAANILGINRNTLRKKITEYDIKCKSKT
jgi:Fis family transcriptional regulator, factor for inversion stimulation protein